MTDELTQKTRSFAEGIFAKVFREMDARPETLIIQNVLLTRDSNLELYVKGGRPEIYLSEQDGRKALSKGDHLYKVRIERVE